jgi:hypothetical protein
MPEFHAEIVARQRDESMRVICPPHPFGFLDAELPAADTARTA